MSNRTLFRTVQSGRILLAFTATAALSVVAHAAPPADPTGKADTDMIKVLAAYQALGAKPVASLTVEQARTQPTPGQAAMVVQQTLTGSAARQPVAKVYDTTVMGAAGPLPARVYDPRVDIATSRPAPVILYFHGGGWVTGNLDTYDASGRALAAGTGAIVLSVQYRLAPEARFPAAQDDADKAYNWLLINAGTLGGDPKRIALAGESAGGNLAIDTAIWARDSRLPAPVAELLVYPVAGTDVGTPSYLETSNAIPLNKAAIEWYVAHFINGQTDLGDKRLNVVGVADLRGLPPTTIVSAQIDPLRSEDEMLAKKMQAAGDDVQQRTFPGVTHEFFGMGSVVAEARLAQQFAIARLSVAFTQPLGAGGMAPIWDHKHVPAD